MYSIKDKKAVRTVVKDASYLYRDGKISESEMREIAASALAWEIAIGLQQKINQKQLHKKGKWTIKRGKNE